MELPSQLHQAENRYSLPPDAATETRLSGDLDITLHPERRAALEYYQNSIITMNEAGDTIENLSRRVDCLELQVASLQEENIRVHVENKQFRHLLEIFGILPELHAESESEGPNASTEMQGDDIVDAKDETSVNMLEAMFDGDSDYESDYNPDEEGNPEDSDTDSDIDATVPLEEVRSMLMDVEYGNGLKVYRPWPNPIADDIMKMDFSEEVPSLDDDMPKEKNDGGKKEEGDLDSKEDVDASVSLKGVQSPNNAQQTTGFLDMNFRDDSNTDDEYIPESDESSESDGTESYIETLQEEVMNLRGEAGYGRIIPGTFHGLLTREVLDNYPLFNMKSLETIECMHEEGKDGKEEDEEDQEKVVKFNILDMDCDEDSESDVDAEYDPNEEEEQSPRDESESEDGSENDNESGSEEEDLTKSILHERLDVALVISTTNVSQSKAIKALEHNDNYIIDAIMYLHETGHAVTKQGLTIWPQPSTSEIKESLESCMSSYMSLEPLNINHNKNSSISHLRLSPESPGKDDPKAAGSLSVEVQDVEEKAIEDPVPVSDEDDTSSLVQISRAQSPVSTSWSVVSDLEEEEK